MARRQSGIDELSREELIELVREQQRQIAVLREEIERLKGGQQRQAAPFSRQQRAHNPKKPGRKKGQGPFRRREAPATKATVTVEVPAPASCPFCGGAVEQERVEFATTTGVPAQPQPEVTLYRVAVCRCTQCHKPVRGTAPGLAVNQQGATAHRVGPSVMAAAHALHYGAGIPVRRVPGVLRELTGVTITQSALSQDALKRAAREVGAHYRQLREAVRQAPLVHTDDTGWRIGGESAFLMGFDTDRATVYQIRRQHRNEEVREIVPAGYAGVMIGDRGKSYDAVELQDVDQQKCLAHILRNLSEVVKTKQGRARDFGVQTKQLLQDGRALWRARHHLPPAVYAEQAMRLERKLGWHLRDRNLKDEHNRRLLHGLGEQQDRGRLLRFLTPPFVEPTNNRAERILRPAVIARKVSHCSKTDRGAEAFAAFASAAQTGLKQGATSVTSAFQALFAPSANGAIAPSRQ